MAVAYSYVRFSSEKQKHGHSLKRQTEAATKYAHAHNLVLDTSTYKDLGVSGFRSKNYIEGSLGAFIEAVDSGRIAKGSYLLVESLDRLSRDTVDVALELFIGIIRRGIIIVTLIEPPEVFSQAIIRDQPYKLMMALVTMWRANEESRTKSDRAIKKFEARREAGQFATNRMPSWLKMNPDKKGATVIPERAKIVKRIFDEVIAGKGAREIARGLNAEKIPTLLHAIMLKHERKPEWRQSSISQLLKNPAVYGEHHGEIRFPVVVTKARWLKAQQIVRDRTLYSAGFKRNNPDNTLAGLARCGDCGRVMRFLPNARGIRYYRCVGAVDNGGCDGRLFPHKACEMALVSHLTMVETNHGLTKAIYTEKHEKAETLDAEIAVMKDKRERLVKLADLSGDIETLGPRLKQYKLDTERLEKERAALGVSTDTQEHMFESVGVFSDYAVFEAGGYPEYKRETTATNITELRVLLKMAFVRVLKRVEFFNANKKKWQPTLRLTYVNDTVDLVDVTEHLPERTQIQMSHGIWHRPDLGVPMKGRKKKKGKRIRYKWPK